MDVEDALELLSSQFTNRAVRQYAVSRLKEANDDVRGYTLISTHEVSFLCMCIYHGTWLAWLQDCMLTKNVNVVKLFQWSCDCVTGLLIDFTTPTCREIGTNWWTVWLSDWLTYRSTDCCAIDWSIIGPMIIQNHFLMIIHVIKACLTI